MAYKAPPSPEILHNQMSPGCVKNAWTAMVRHARPILAYPADFAGMRKTVAAFLSPFMLSSTRASVREADG